MRRGDYHSIQMRGHSGYLAGLVEAGFDVLNLANNHSLQHGRATFQETVDIVSGAGIAACGVKALSGAASEPAVVEKNGLRIAFLGYSLRPRQYFTEEPLYVEGRRRINSWKCVTREPRFRGRVAALGRRIHRSAVAGRNRLAHDVMDAGADLIVGHHPHVLRGVERYGRGYIVYSLGNFVCDMFWDEHAARDGHRAMPAHAGRRRDTGAHSHEDWRRMPAGAAPWRCGRSTHRAAGEALNAARAECRRPNHVGAHGAIPSGRRCGAPGSAPSVTSLLSSPRLSLPALDSGAADRNLHQESPRRTRDGRLRTRIPMSQPASSGGARSLALALALATLLGLKRTTRRSRIAYSRNSQEPGRVRRH